MRMNICQRKRLGAAFLCIKADRNSLYCTYIVNSTSLVKVCQSNVTVLFVHAYRSDGSGNLLYQSKLALIQKIPTPITPVRMDKENRHITLAYFDQRSTVDYIGAVQGIPVCFDAKECSAQTFPLANIHPHQVKFMEDFEKQNGVAFFLIFFSQLNLFYYLPFRELLAYWRRMEEGGRKSFRREELDEKYYLPKKSGFLVPYLEGLKLDLETRVLP